MFPWRSRSRSRDISRHLQDLKEDVALLAEALTEAAQDATRQSRHRAGSAAQAMMGEAGEQAHRFADASRAFAARGSQQMAQHADEWVGCARDVAMRHPRSTALAVVGVGIVALCMFKWVATRESADARRSSSGFWRSRKWDA